MANEFLTEEIFTDRIAECLIQLGGRATATEVRDCYAENYRATTFLQDRHSVNMSHSKWMSVDGKYSFERRPGGGFVMKLADELLMHVPPAGRNPAVMMAESDDEMEIDNGAAAIASEGLTIEMFTNRIVMCLRDIEGPASLKDVRRCYNRKFAPSKFITDRRLILPGEGQWRRQTGGKFTVTYIDYEWILELAVREVQRNVHIPVINNWAPPPAGNNRAPAVLNPLRNRNSDDMDMDDGVPAKRYRLA